MIRCSSIRFIAPRFFPTTPSSTPSITTSSPSSASPSIASSPTSESGSSSFAVLSAIELFSEFPNSFFIFLESSFEIRKF